MISLKTIPSDLLRRLRMRLLEFEGADLVVSQLSHAIHRELDRRANGGRVRRPLRANVELFAKLVGQKSTAFSRILLHLRR